MLILIMIFNSVAFATVGNGSVPTCLTSQCHSNLIEKKYIHGPVKSKGCTVCHQVLDSTSKKHPTLKKPQPQEVNQICFVCHEEYQTQISKAKRIHGAIEKKSCVGCHDPHQSDRVTLLKLSPQKELCLSCHEDIGKKMKSAKFHLIDKMEKGCLTCHETHTSESSGKLIKAQRVQELCLKCHQSEVLRTNGKHLRPLVFEPLDSSLIHKPVQEQACIKCHEVHGSTMGQLLSHEYTKENPALCFECHDLKKTQFRNGSKDLHKLHLDSAKNKKSCQTCHDPHQSMQGHLIKKEFESRGQLLPINYSKLENGGTCTTTCHKSFEYNRSEATKNVSDR